MSSDDRKAIEQTVQTYLDGLYEGDAEKLASVKSVDVAVFSRGLRATRRTARRSSPA